jgi:hypothetical protein
MTEKQVFHRNQWHDYCGGSDHSIDEIAACDAEQDAAGEERREHVLIISAEEYIRLSGGPTEKMELKVTLTGQARDEFIEGIVIGALKSMRDIDEPLVRARWRAMSADTPLRNAVLQIVGHNGEEYEIVLATLEKALGAI